MSYQKIALFLFELGMLKHIHREGWKLIGVKTPETVAEHSLRAAQIGYILAKLEGHPNPEEISTMLVFHDIAECRIGDIHKLAIRYIQRDEEQVVKEQLSSLSEINEDIIHLWEQFDHKSTRAGVIAKDADLLELIVTAYEYLSQGFKEAEDWIRNTEKKLSTDSAKKILQTLKEVDPYKWWYGLKKLDE